MDAARDALERFVERVEEREAVVAVLGLGCVGLPLALAFHRSGLRVLGYDVDAEKLATLARGENPLRYVNHGAVEAMLASGRFEAVGDPERLAEADALVICVPTPLDAAREPDLSCVEEAARAVAKALRAGQLVVLESTTWPGTTREVVKPILEASGLRAGRDVWLAYSPEREDPGRPEHSAARVPKLVGALDDPSLRAARALYEAAGIDVRPVASAEVAEAAKLLENTFRAVNIALVNELKVALDALGIDVWDVIEAAATKPFGFMRFEPGPGMGGHCIPIDPFYLAWIARRAGASTRFVELAGEINRRMPEYVVERALAALAQHGVEARGARVLVLGLAYKPEVDTTYESPALRLIELLHARGARLSFSDPWVARAPESHRALLANERSLALDDEAIAAFDLVLVATDHKDFDRDAIARSARIVVDTRDALGSRMRGDPRYHRA